MIAVAALAVGCAHNQKCCNMKAHEEGNETKISIDQVPAAARATLEREAGGAKLTTVDKEMRHGKTVYEADAMSGGKNWEIVVNEDGTLVSKKLDNEEEEHHGKKSEKEEDEKDEKDE